MHILLVSSRVQCNTWLMTRWQPAHEMSLQSTLCTHVGLQQAPRIYTGWPLLKHSGQF